MATLAMTLVKKPQESPHSVRIKAATEIGKWVNATPIGELDATQETWILDRDRADFTVVIGLDANGQTVQILLTAEKAEKASLSVWQLLEKGTKTRPMHLSREGHPDGAWQSKTFPRNLFSGAGAGAKIGIWKPYDRGITKRDWVETMAKQNQASQDLVVRYAYENALDSYFNA